MPYYSGAYDPMSPQGIKIQADTIARFAAERKIRVDAATLAVKAILDRGNIVGAQEIFDIVVANSRPMDSEVWEAIRNVIFKNKDYGMISNNTYGKI